MILNCSKKFPIALVVASLGIIWCKGCGLPSLGNPSSRSLTSEIKTISIFANRTLEMSRSFTEWCQNRENLPPQKRHTVEVLLKEARTNDCAKAEGELLAQRTLSLYSYQIEDVTPLASLSKSKIYILELFDNQIRDISPLASFTQLGHLNLQNNQIQNIAPLGTLTNLINLDLSFNRIKEIPSLEKLTNLDILDLSSNQIEDISRLETLPNLRILDLTSNQITNIIPLTSLNRLGSLYISDNQIQDITPLTALSQTLGTLLLSSNQIEDISPLAKLEKLAFLLLASNPIKDITPLAKLTNLIDLDLSSNPQIEDISPLASLTQLNNLYLASNQLENIAPLAALTNLSHLNLASNQIEDISPLTSLTNLSILDLSDNQIQDISPLISVFNQSKSLHWLNLSSNQIEDIASFVSSTNLAWLNLIDNPLSSPRPSIFEEEEQAIFPNAPPPPPLPAKLPRPLYRPELHRQQGIYYLKDSTYHALKLDSFGVGHLIPRPTKDPNVINSTQSRPFSYGGWLGDVVLPLYQQPEGILQGWIARGRLLKTTLSEETPFIVDERPFALLQGGYKGSYPSLVVLEIRPDGWFRFRYTHPTEEDDGTAWAHQSHLRLGAFHLALQTWEEFLSEYQGFFLYFRDEKPHALHILPNENSRVLTQTTNNGENKIEFLEFQGEWAKINLKFYKPYICQTDSKVVAEYQGWVRWRSSELGSLMWYAGAGC